MWAHIYIYIYIYRERFIIYMCMQVRIKLPNAVNHHRDFADGRVLWQLCRKIASHFLKKLSAAFKTRACRLQPLWPISTYTIGVLALCGILPKPFSCVVALQSTRATINILHGFHSFQRLSCCVAVLSEGLGWDLRVCMALAASAATSLEKASWETGEIEDRNNHQ